MQPSHWLRALVHVPYCQGRLTTSELTQTWTYRSRRNMNILPKKSWHVRNKDNIERVRRDEARAAEEEKEKQRRIALAEQEARTDFLRKKAKYRQIEGSASHKELASTSQNSIVPSQQTFGHINFFKDEEEGKKHGTNEEYQAEKKAEKEKYEKDIGLLTYLGQSAVESQQSKPWYFKVPDRKRKLDKESAPKSKKTSREEFDQKRKYDLDPMRQMTKYMEIKEKHKDKGKKKGKKHKHDRKDRDDQRKEKIPSGKKTIEQLRADRLKREKEERKRAEEVITKAKGEYVPVKEKEVIVDERQRSYNSQFNPDFVRKPRPKPYY